MARKVSVHSESSRGFNDIIGVVLMGFAVLLLVALFSYHPRDVSANILPTNPSVRNWIGPFGAWMACGCFRWTGAAAYLLPVLLFLVGLGCFFDGFAYLRRRWAWEVVLFLCCMGLLDLYKDHFDTLQRNINAPAGGIIGLNLNQHLFDYFGTAGATIIYLMLYFISLLFLTNFQLGNWVRSIWGRRPAMARGQEVPEQTLDRRANDLQKQVSKLQEQTDRSGLGPDMKPVPAPTVRDLSVPQASKSSSGRKPAPPTQPEPAKVLPPADEGEVIPANEVKAATTEEILGKKSESADKSAETKPADAKADDPAAQKPEAEPKPEPPNRRSELTASLSAPGPGNRRSPSPFPSPPRP